MDGSASAILLVMQRIDRVTSVSSGGLLMESMTLEMCGACIAWLENMWSERPSDREMGWGGLHGTGYNGS